MSAYYKMPALQVAAPSVLSTPSSQPSLGEYCVLCAQSNAPIANRLASCARAVSERELVSSFEFLIPTSAACTGRPLWVAYLEHRNNPISHPDRIHDFPFVQVNSLRFSGFPSLLSLFIPRAPLVTTSNWVYQPPAVDKFQRLFYRQEKNE